MNLITFLREQCLAFKAQTGLKLVGKETLLELALDLGYEEEDVESVLRHLPALVNDKHFPL